MHIIRPEIQEERLVFMTFDKVDALVYKVLGTSPAFYAVFGRPYPATFLPHFHRKRSDFSAPDAPRANDRPWESAAGELTREERNAAIRGALKAGLLIAGVYILAAAALIVAMQLLWS